MDDQLRWAVRQFVEEFKWVFTADALAQVRARAEELARAEVQRVLDELKTEGEVGRRPPGPEYPRAEDI